MQSEEKTIQHLKKHINQSIDEIQSKIDKLELLIYIIFHKLNYISEDQLRVREKTNRHTIEEVKAYYKIL